MRNLWKGLLAGGLIGSALVYTLYQHRKKTNGNINHKIRRGTRQLRRNLVRVVDVAGHRLLTKVVR